MKTEIWKDIEGYEGFYQISNLGNVRSLKDRWYNYRIKNISPSTYNGYKHVSLFFGKAKSFKIHRLVAQAFIVNEHDKKYINHKNGIRDDNRVENLEWCTFSENIKHSFEQLGRKPSALGKFGYDNPSSKPVLQFTKDLEFIKEYPNARNAKSITGIAYESISKNCNNKLKYAGGFIWKFKTGS